MTVAMTAESLRAVLMDSLTVAMASALMHHGSAMAQLSSVMQDGLLTVLMARTKA
jgi:hypothetical protein